MPVSTYVPEQSGDWFYVYTRAIDACFSLYTKAIGCLFLPIYPSNRVPVSTYVPEQSGDWFYLCPRAIDACFSLYTKAIGCLFLPIYPSNRVPVSRACMTWQNPDDVSLTVMNTRYRGASYPVLLMLVFNPSKMCTLYLESIALSFSWLIPSVLAPRFLPCPFSPKSCEAISRCVW